MQEIGEMRGECAHLLGEEAIGEAEGTHQLDGGLPLARLEEARARPKVVEAVG